ncbi:MAG: trypsin-like serine protease [bacterium]
MTFSQSACHPAMSFTTDKALSLQVLKFFNIFVTRALTFWLGWGATSYGGELSPVLLEALLPITSQEQCEKSYPRLEISDSQLCAGYKEGGRDSCQVKECPNSWVKCSYVRLP